MSSYDFDYDSSDDEFSFSKSYVSNDYYESEYSDLEFYFYDNESNYYEDYQWDWVSISQYCSDIKALNKYQKYINWDIISKNRFLTLEFVREHKNKLDWSEVSKWATSEIIEEFEDKIDFSQIIDSDRLTDELIERHSSELNWNKISSWISLDILNNYDNMINWKKASRNKNLSDELIREHQDELNWIYVCRFCSTEILIEFEHIIINGCNICLCYIIENENLTIELIRKYSEHWERKDLEHVIKWASKEIIEEFTQITKDREF